MKLTTRRIILGIGAALLVGGWGMTRYAVLFSSNAEVMVAIWEGYVVDWPPMKLTFTAGIVTMTIGAGLLGFGALRGENP